MPTKSRISTRPGDTLWVAGRTRPEDHTYAWELLGIFDREGLAVARCTWANDFVGPVRLNEPFPDPVTAWTGAYYPGDRPNRKD